MGGREETADRRPDERPPIEGKELPAQGGGEGATGSDEIAGSRGRMDGSDLKPEDFSGHGPSDRGRTA